MELFVNHIQFAFKLNTIIFPLDSKSLEDEVDDLGYKRVQKGQTTPDGLQIKPGDFAMKNNTVINVNPQSQIFGITSTKSKEILPIFYELKEILAKSNVDVDKNAYAYSIVGEFFIETDKDVIQQIQKFSALNKISSLKDLVFGDPSPYSIVLVPKGGKLTDEEFYQFRLEPNIQRLGREYLVQFSRRSKDREKIEKLISIIEERVLKIIEEIEK